MEGCDQAARDTLQMWANSLAGKRKTGPQTSYCPVGVEMMTKRDGNESPLFVGSLVASFVDSAWIDKARDNVCDKGKSRCIR